MYHSFFFLSLYVFFSFSCPAPFHSSAPSPLLLLLLLLFWAGMEWGSFVVIQKFIARVLKSLTCPSLISALIITFHTCSSFTSLLPVRLLPPLTCSSKITFFLNFPRVFLCSHLSPLPPSPVLPLINHHLLHLKHIHPLSFSLSFFPTRTASASQIYSPLILTCFLTPSHLSSLSLILTCPTTS